MVTKKTGEHELQLVDEVPASKEIAPISSQSPIMLALSQGATPDQLDKIMDMQERHERREAEKAFNMAMSKFRANAPKIDKNKNVSYEGQKGAVSYSHATLGNIVDKISAALSEQGLSHRWTTLQGNGVITVTCTLTHSLGHSVSTTLSSAPDQSGGKNSIQAIGSAKTYLERYTLLGITGCAPDEDDDGMAAANRLELTASQLKYVENLISKKGNVNMDKLLKHFKADSLGDIQQRDYNELVVSLGGKVSA